MIVRDIKRLALMVGPLLVLLLLAIGYWDHAQPSDWFRYALSSTDDGQPAPPPGSDAAPDSTHHEIFSVSTRDRKYFDIQFGSQEALNPNIIPHHTLRDNWIIVAQRNKSSAQWFAAEIWCTAAFSKGALRCIEEPAVLPIAATYGDGCLGEFDLLAGNVGPHDARVFYGPGMPYIMYGSNSEFTCFGQWLQDGRPLMEWTFQSYQKDQFRSATELQRPPPYSPLEKNFFVFWDKDNQSYVHHDMAPKRVFAKLSPDGTVGRDLAPDAAASDDRCMEKLMPKVRPDKEKGMLQSIHQATNSLLITLCRRADPDCQPNDANTFVFHIFQDKTFYMFHSTYEPYVVLFHQRAPFEMYALSSKPLWIHGRKRQTEIKSEMFYVVSMSWKDHDQQYHGYLDDVLFLSFGIEDSKTAAIDVLASDLLANLGLCSET